MARHPLASRLARSADGGETPPLQERANKRRQQEGVYRGGAGTGRWSRFSFRLAAACRARSAAFSRAAMAAALTVVVDGWTCTVVGVFTRPPSNTLAAWLG